MHTSVLVPVFLERMGVSGEEGQLLPIHLPPALQAPWRLLWSLCSAWWEAQVRWACGTRWIGCALSCISSPLLTWLGDMFTCPFNPDSTGGYPFDISICSPCLTLELRHHGSMGRGNEVEISVILFHEIRTSSNSWERKEQTWSLVSLPVMHWLFVSSKIHLLNPNA